MAEGENDLGVKVVDERLDKLLKKYKITYKDV
jgi:hypothetical protein